MLIKPLSIGLAVAAALSARADYDPITLTPSSYNFDIVVEASAPPPLPYCITVTQGSGTPTGDFTFYERGIRLGSPTVGLPHPGEVFACESTSAIQFQMAPSYTTNDVMLLDSSVPSGTLTLSSPSTYTNLSFLSTSGNGSTVVSYILTHQDSTTETGSFTIGDWYNGSSVALTVSGRINYQGGFQDVSGNPRMYYKNITVTGTSPITQIAFTYTSGGHGGIYAISGNASGTHWTPITVTGYNQDTIVELCPAVTATMDRGTNITYNDYQDTWYEQGYNTNAPTTGLPHAGVAFNSLLLPDHHYKLAPFNANNAILIDADHLVATITPQSPASYSAFSLLTAGGNVGGANTMTNIIILQHQDGTSETNFFYGYDWFNSQAAAFQANGRVNLNGRTMNNVNNTYPKLFESQFGLQNVSSPVTNILLKYSSAPDARSTTFIMAVSASTGGVIPVVAVQPHDANCFSNSATGLSFTLSAGTAPLSYQWERASSLTGPWAPVTGVNISGATTMSLGVQSFSPADVGYYHVIITNASGVVTSSPARLSILSNLPDVTLPGDDISVVGGTSSGAEGPTNAINNSTGKMLITGPSTSPFTTPIGFVITPSQGSSTVSGLRFYTANDATSRDPMDYTFEGSTDGGATYSTISSGPLLFPDARNTGGKALSPTNQAVTELLFANSTAYSTYRLTFGTVRGGTATSLLQFGEVELLGAVTPGAPIIGKQPSESHTAYVGGSLTLTTTAHGVAPLTYQWYMNSPSTPIANATNTTLTVTNLQKSVPANNYFCRVTNPYGFTDAQDCVVTVLSVPTTAYISAVTADQPVGFWRLDESANSLIAMDVIGGHDGSYSNITLGFPGSINGDSATAPYFGDDSHYTPQYVGNINGISVSAANGSSSAFSVEAWAWSVDGQLATAGLITLGAWAGEAFSLDMGAGTAELPLLRFSLRDASGNFYATTNSNAFNDGVWHYIVGIVDQPHGTISLYVDGKLSDSVSIPVSNGVYPTTVPMTIGNRMAADGTYAGDLQFYGRIDDVAVYKYALTPAQILNHFSITGVAPLSDVVPTNTTALEGTSATFKAAALGTLPLHYQWYRYPNIALGGQTNSTLVLSNVSASLDQTYYYVIASNQYGSITLPDPSVYGGALLTVDSGIPHFTVNLPAQSTVYMGRSATFAVTVGGTAPFTYQWQYNGVNLTEGGRVSGSKSNLLTIANTTQSDAGNYSVLVTNSKGGPVASATDALTLASHLDFSGNGAGWAANGGASFANDSIVLTDGTADQTRSTFNKFPQFIGGFTASFTYLADLSNNGADGAAFVIQNNPAGASALGNGGGSLGYASMTNSVALELNLYQSASMSPGWFFATNGIIPSSVSAVYHNVGAVDLKSGDPINVELYYNGSSLEITFTDVTTGDTYSTTLAGINIPAVVGTNVAYIGFTGADGQLTSIQTISNVFFASIPVVTAKASGSSAVLTWPSYIGGYVLQQTPSLTNPSWQDVSSTLISVVNGQNQFTGATGSASAFYRLVLR